MKSLYRKLYSQRGASILLALLFLLVCMMVGASVLMAAVSNAGKIRSNYEEQQRYLALSSALRLVVDELEQARYQGRYTVTEWNETIIAKDENGQDFEVSNINYYNVTQEPGTFTCGDLAASGTPEENTVLTFRKELDRVFSGKFGGTGYEGLEDKDTASLPTNPSGDFPGAPAPSTRSLTVEVTDGTNTLEQFGSVIVKIDMSQSRRIHLTAMLPTEKTDDEKPNMDGVLYIMEAELAASLVEIKADGSTEELSAGGVPSISYSPGTRLPKDSIPASGPVPEGELKVTVKDPALEEKTKDAVTWQLDWITKEMKSEEAGG